MDWGKVFLKMGGLLVLWNGIYGLFTGAALQFPGSRSGDLAWVTIEEYPLGFWIYILIFIIAGLWLLFTDLDK